MAGASEFLAESTILVRVKNVNRKIAFIFSLAVFNYYDLRRVYQASITIIVLSKSFDP